MIRLFSLLLFVLQVFGSAMVGAMLLSSLTSDVRNPELGLGIVLIGLPVALFNLLVLPFLFAMRASLPDRFRGAIMMVSAALGALSVLLFGVIFKESGG